MYLIQMHRNEQDNKILIIIRILKMWSITNKDYNDIIKLISHSNYELCTPAKKFTQKITLYKRFAFGFLL